MNKFEYMNLVSEFTKHVNKTLRNEQSVVSWDFCIEEDVPDDYRKIFIHIEFIKGLHSRTVFDLFHYAGKFNDIEHLKAEFDYQLEKSFRQVEEILGGK